MANLESRKWQNATLADVDKAIANIPNIGGGGDVNPLREKAFRNVTRAGTQRLRTALARAMNGTGRGRIICIGDSYTSGYMVRANNHAGARRGRFGGQVAKQLAARGWAVRNDSFMGDCNCDDINDALAAYQDDPDNATPANRKPKIAVTGGMYLYDRPYLTLGGRLWAVEGAAGTITFTPDAVFDTIDVLLANNGGTSTIGVTFNGDGTTTQAGTTISMSGIEGVRKFSQTLTGTTLVGGGVAGQAVSIKLTRSTGNMYIAGIVCRNSKAPGVDVIVGAATGTPMMDWSLAPVYTPDYDKSSFNVRTSLAALVGDDWDTVPTTFIVDGGANDWDPTNTDGGQSNAQIQASATTLINQLKAYGDVVWVGYGPMSPAYAGGGTGIETAIPALNEALFSTAIGLGCPVVDPMLLLPPDFATANTLGYMGDSLHLRTQGHAVVARAIIAMLDAVV